jgi:hypothetical protein
MGVSHFYNFFILKVFFVKKTTSVKFGYYYYLKIPGNTKGGSITVPLTSCLTGLD